MTKLALWLFAILLGANSCGQRLDNQNISQDEVRRLAELCKVWGKIKMFSPTASTQMMLWDSALLRTIRLVRLAGDSAELTAAYIQMYATLNDPAMTEPADYHNVWTPIPPIQIDSLDQGVYTIYIDQPWALSPSSYRSSLTGIGSRQVVIDLRSKPAANAIDLYVEDSLRDLIGSLFEHAPVDMPEGRRIKYIGYKPQGQGGSQMYQKFYIPAGDTSRDHPLRFTGKGRIAKPIIFVLNSNSVGATRIATALRKEKIARIIIEGEVPRETGVEIDEIALSTGATLKYSTTENVLARMYRGVSFDTVVQSYSPEVRSAVANSNYWKEMRFSIDPAFQEEIHQGDDLPDANMRLLTLFRLWNVVEYFFPYKHLMDLPWDQTLADMIPVFLNADDWPAMHDAVLTTAARMQDDHVGTGHEKHQESLGRRWLPIGGRFLNSEFVITSIDAGQVHDCAVRIGDRLLSIDGVSTDSLRSQAARLISHSGPMGLNTKFAWRMMRSNDSVKRLVIKSPDGTTREMMMATASDYNFREDSLPVYRVLDPKLDVHYIDLTRLQKQNVVEVYGKARYSKCIVLDMRGYPRGTIWTLAPLLCNNKAMVANYKMLQLAHPDSVATSWQHEEEWVEPQKGKGYSGKIIVLIDDQAISQSEHSCLFLKALGNVTFIGTTTRGANGDVTNTLLPRGYQVGFTGLYVGYPDGTELQRRGIIPDIRIEPTYHDIATGNDAVLNRALQFFREQNYLNERSKQPSKN